jgi:phage major head subunit gpT-like protein
MNLVDIKNKNTVDEGTDSKRKNIGLGWWTANEMSQHVKLESIWTNKAIDEVNVGGRSEDKKKLKINNEARG